MASENDSTKIGERAFGPAEISTRGKSSWPIHIPSPVRPLPAAAGPSGRRSSPASNGFPGDCGGHCGWRKGKNADKSRARLSKRLGLSSLLAPRLLLPLLLLSLLLLLLMLLSLGVATLAAPRSSFYPSRTHCAAPTSRSIRGHRNFYFEQWHICTYNWPLLSTSLFFTLIRYSCDHCLARHWPIPPFAPRSTLLRQMKVVSRELASTRSPINSISFGFSLALIPKLTLLFRQINCTLVAKAAPTSFFVRKLSAAITILIPITASCKTSSFSFFFFFFLIFVSFFFQPVPSQRPT
jgi:hypothetical protein